MVCGEGRVRKTVVREHAAAVVVDDGVVVCCHGRGVLFVKCVGVSVVVGGTDGAGTLAHEEEPEELELVHLVCADDLSVGVDEVYLLGADAGDVEEERDDEHDGDADAEAAAEDDVPVLGREPTGGVLGAVGLGGGGGAQRDGGVVV